MGTSARAGECGRSTQEEKILKTPSAVAGVRRLEGQGGRGRR